MSRRRSETIQTDYNGTRLFYDEEAGLWHCHSLKMEAPQLAELKRKIAKLDAQARRVSVPILEIRSGWGSERKPFAPRRAVLIADEKQCWTVDKDGSNRDKGWMHNMILDTPENRETIKVYIKKAREAAKLDNELKKMLEAIPRVTSDDLKLLTAEAEEDSNG